MRPFRLLMPCAVLVAAGCGSSVEPVERTGESAQALIIHPDGPAQPPLQDKGGPTINEPRIVHVSWGTNVDPALLDILPSFYSDLATGGYLNTLFQYGLDGASFGGMYTILPVNRSSGLSKDDIGSELSLQVKAGNLPGDPAGVPHTLYVVHFPPGYALADGNGGSLCSDGNCADHNYASDVAFAEIPNQATCGACASLVAQEGAYNVTTWVVTHEIEEAVTDPEPGNPAWLDATGQEIADKCNFPVMYEAASGVQWFVCSAWLNSLGGCSKAGGTTPTPAASVSGNSPVLQGGELALLATDPQGDLFADYSVGGNQWGALLLQGSFAARPFTPVALTARTSSLMDGFYFDNGGALQTAAWNGASWTQLPMSWAAAGVPGAYVSAIARSPSNLDIFYVAKDGSVESGFFAGSGWTPDLVQPPGSPAASKAGSAVVAVAPEANQIDAFWVTNGGVVTSRGQGYGSAWTAPAVVSSSFTLANGGGGLAAVVDSGNQEEVFFARDDGQLGVAFGLGTQWTTVVAPGVSVPKGAPIAAVPLGAVEHGFVIGTDANVWDAALSTSGTVTRITSAGNVTPGGWIAALATPPSRLDVFYFDNLGNLDQATNLGGASPWTTAVIAQAAAKAPTNCSATLHCEDLITFSCDPSPYTLDLQAGAGQPIQWEPIGEGGQASWGPNMSASEFRVCAESAEGGCTLPFGLSGTVYTDCGGSGGGGGGGGSSGGVGSGSSGGGTTGGGKVVYAQ